MGMDARRWLEMNFDQITILVGDVTGFLPLKAVAEKLAASHVMSFKNSFGEWAGYSPSNVLYWVAGKDYPNAQAAAQAMVGQKWSFVDMCIDEEL